jgi:FMN phosphatase YigB (HAD superfamily)
MQTVFLSLVLANSFLFAAPQTVVFNYGGVLVGKGDSQAIADFVQDSLDLSNTELELFYLAKQEAVKSGEITDERFWIALAEKRHIILPKDWEQTFKTVKQQSIRVNYEVYQIVEQLKKNDVRVVLISNVDS